MTLDVRNEFGADEPSLGVLLRLEADGELPEAWRPALEACIAEDSTAAERIEFERTLRKQIGRSMHVTAPADFRQQVRLALAEAELAEAELAEQDGDLRLTRSDDDAALPTPVAPPPARRMRIGGNWGGGLAIAAALLMLVSVVYYSVQSGMNAGDPAGFFRIQEAGFQLRQFVTWQADACADFQRQFERKMQVRELAEIPEQYAEHLEYGAPVIDLAGCGYEFRGVGPCHVPLNGNSLHYIYESAAGEALSIFVQDDEGAIGDLEPGTLYEFAKPDSISSVLCWTEGGQIYYLVPPPDRAADEVARSMKAPENRERIRS
jgi:hypothetical protein